MDKLAPPESPQPSEDHHSTSLDSPGTPSDPSAVEPLLCGWELLSEQRLDEAERCFADRCRLEPGDAGAWSLLGVTRHRLEKLELALEALDRAVAIAPDYVDAHTARAAVLLETGRPEDALAACRCALAITPEDPHLLTNTGVVLEKMSQPEAALEHYERALRLDRTATNALINRAYVLAGLGRFDKALASYERLIALEPERADAYADRGSVLLALGHYAAALESHRAALQQEPTHSRALVGRAIALSGLGRFPEAEKAFTRARDVDPQALQSSYRDALEGDALAGSDVDPRVVCLHLGFQRLRACGWSGREELIRGIDHVVHASAASGRKVHDRALAHGSYMLPLDLETHWLLAKGIGERIRGNVGSQTHLWVTSPSPPRGRLRIGYLSADFRPHPMSQLTRRLFGLHDRERFEVHGYAIGPGADSRIRAELAATFDVFTDLADLDDADAGYRIYRDHVDILVDLGGYTEHSRTEILAYRPAPVQVTYLGYHATLGADFIDYHVTDARASPPGGERYWVEKLAYLPESFFVYNDRQTIAPSPTRAEAGLPDEGFVFCAFHQSLKIEPSAFGVWIRLLRRVPGSVLWLLGDDPMVRENLTREAAARDVSPERLVFAPRLALEHHLARLRLADLYLDTLCYNAHTTACDALWAGLPVLTCAGDNPYSRIGGSLLGALRLPELVTETVEDYEECAYSLATQPERLRELREKLARQRLEAPLFDTERTVRHLERAYEMMWERHRRGEPPESFRVPADPATPP